MNFIFPDTPEAVAAASEPIYDFGAIFFIIGIFMLFFVFLACVWCYRWSYTQKVTAIIVAICGVLSLVGGLVFSFAIRPAIIAEAEADTPEPVSVLDVFQQVAKDTYDLDLTRQNAEDLLTREGYYTLEPHQLEGDMQEGEAGQVWRAGQIEIAPDGQYQALQLIWVDDEWLIIDITDPNQAGLLELERINNDTN